MTRITRIFAVPMAIGLTVAGLVFNGCKKPPMNTPPEPDTEVETALDAMWATYVITDIDHICSFLGVNELIKHYYVTEVVRPDPNATMINIAWNQTKCLDGRVRHGAIDLNYTFDPLPTPGPDPHARYYHEFRFAGKISLLAYKVDGWLIEEYDERYPAYVYNKLETNQFDPRVVNLKWLIAGKFSFTHPSDPSRNMVWEGSLLKTLVNTADPKVYSLAGQPAITWTNAVVSYSGHVTGLTHANVPFKMEIGQNNQLVRDFSCSANKIVPSDGRSGYRTNEHHPFMRGIASFTTGDAYPRQIYVGNEGNPDLAPQCDNSGEILIKGISYKVNFRE